MAIARGATVTVDEEWTYQYQGEIARFERFNRRASVEDYIDQAVRVAHLDRTDYVILSRTVITTTTEWEDN